MAWNIPRLLNYEVNWKTQNQSRHQVEGILLGLDSRVSAVRQQLNKLKNEVENAKKQMNIGHCKADAAVLGAKRKLDDLQRFGQILVMKNCLREYRGFAAQNDYGRDYGMMPCRAFVRLSLTSCLNIAFGIIIGLVVGVSLAFFIEYLDTSV